MATCIRRSVPNDHSCLFWALAYAAQPRDSPPPGRQKANQLREICAEDALKDSDQLTRALILGHDSVEDYAKWIRNEFHWGGENEIVTLARHYAVEVAVVCCESLRVLAYGSDNANSSERVYLLYTGQHYDPLVAGPDASVLTTDERRRFPKGDCSLEALALDVARAHNVEAARKAAQRQAKRIRCSGCGALCDDSEAFAKHCQEVEHDDDFAFECEEVMVVIEGGEPLPEGTMDLSDTDKVHTFYNTELEPFSGLHASAVQVDGTSYRTLEHYWQCAPFLGNDSNLVASIAAAPTPQEARAAAFGAGPDAQRPDWRDRRYNVMLEAQRAKFAQNAPLAEALLATGEKTVVCIDTDPWSGMQAPGGIPTGQNMIGKALMEVRAGLRSSMAAI